LGEDEKGRELDRGRSWRPFFSGWSRKNLIEGRVLLGESGSIGDPDGGQERIGHRGRRWFLRGYFGVFRKWVLFLEILLLQDFGEIP
jgi:hypothetical protein